ASNVDASSARTFSARFPASLPKIETSASTVARHSSLERAGSSAASTIAFVRSFADAITCSTSGQIVEADIATDESGVRLLVQNPSDRFRNHEQHYCEPSQIRSDSPNPVSGAMIAIGPFATGSLYFIVTMSCARRAEPRATASIAHQMD